MSGATTCLRCTAGVQRTDRFCESCGASLADLRRVRIPRTAIPEGPCADCGNDIRVDGYCTVCGHRPAEADRDSAELCGIALITDRGREHAGNEDAAAAGVVGGAAVDGHLPGSIAVAVCDGVSSSGDAASAAVAASTAGVDAMLAALAGNRSGRAAVLAGLAEAAKAAVAVRTTQSVAPSCTYSAAVVASADVVAVEITVGNVGDSRAYWLPESPSPAELLTVDDSVAQELLAAGVPADSAAVAAGAHTLTRWLGADAEAKPWVDSNVRTVTVDGPGALLLCSDGLWNYLPGTDAIRRFCTGVDPAAAARALVEFALASGGQDNITVVIVPIGGSHESG